MAPTHKSVWAPKCGVPGTLPTPPAVPVTGPGPDLASWTAATSFSAEGRPKGLGLEAPDATGEVAAVPAGVFCRRVSSFEMASARTSGSTEGCCSLEALRGGFEGVISVMRELGPSGRRGGDRGCFGLEMPSRGGGMDMMVDVAEITVDEARDEA